MTNNDAYRKALIDRLSKESPMVVSTAYMFAKNYAENGIDITKAFSTAVQQSSVIQKISQKAWVEAYDSFKADYEARLKADKVAMLEELQLEIEERVKEEEIIDKKWANGLHYSEKIIQQKIDTFKSESEDKKLK